MYSDLRLWLHQTLLDSSILSALFIQVYAGIFSYIQHYISYSHYIIKVYSSLFRHIQHPVKHWHIHNFAIFWGPTYLEPDAYSKPCETLTRHTQNPAIGHYSGIFRNLCVACIFLHIFPKCSILYLWKDSEYACLSKSTH